MTLSDRVIPLAQQGIRPPIIARRLDAPVSSVYSIISKARKSGLDIPHFSTGKLEDPTLPRQELRFNLDPDTADTMMQEAMARGISPSRLARDLLTAICEDRMFDAVLDDDA